MSNLRTQPGRASLTMPPASSRNRRVVQIPQHDRWDWYMNLPEPLSSTTPTDQQKLQMYCINVECLHPRPIWVALGRCVRRASLTPPQVRESTNPRPEPAPLGQGGGSNHPRSRGGPDGLGMLKGEPMTWGSQVACLGLAVLAPNQARVVD